MKRYISCLLVVLLTVGLLLAGCGGNQQEKQEQQEPQQQTEQTEQPQGEISTLTGEFQGLADGHSVEVSVDGEAREYQFYDEAIAEVLNNMETGTTIQFDVEADAENTDLLTIVKIYDTPAQG